MTNTSTADPDEAAWCVLNDALVRHLVQSGALTDPRWQDAFRATPRHVFVPHFHTHAGTTIGGGDPSTRDEWLREVYSDTSLVVQRAPAPGYRDDLSTSSSTMPSLMARMLDLLAVEDGHRVLEIGTATGYNAALLCHRVGDDNVTSLELHPDLAESARQHLALVGQRPTVLVRNGAGGHDAGAPYDRIIATCAADAIPPAWITQLRVGGRIVTDLRSEMSSNLTVLTKTTPDSVTGRLLGQPGHFMWLRPDAVSPLLHPDKPKLIVDYNGDNTTTVESTIDPSQLNRPGLRALIGMLEPSMHAPIGQNGEKYFLYTDDGAWCEAHTEENKTIVVQGGSRHLWDSIERATHEWDVRGRPELGRYGVTAFTDGTNMYWLDELQNTILTEIGR